MSYQGYSEGDDQIRRSYRLAMQGGWTQGAKWTRRFLWVLGIGWLVMVIGINLGMRKAPSVAEFLISLYLIPAAVQGGKLWEPITAPWFPTLCTGLFHILCLFVFGPRIERELGSVRFLRFYLLLAYISTLVSLLLRSLSPDLAVIPASTAAAAVFGVMVAYAVRWPREPFWLFGLVPLQVVYVVIALCGLEILSFIVSGAAGTDYVADVTAIGLSYFAAKTVFVRGLLLGGERTGGKSPVSRQAALARGMDRGKSKTVSEEPKKKDRAKFMEL
jgi:membrane associated rhomboid family serine protease